MMGVEGWDIERMEEIVAILTGFGAFVAIPEEKITENITRRVLAGEKAMMVWWSMKAGAHAAAHSHPHADLHARKVKVDIAPRFQINEKFYVPVIAARPLGRRSSLRRCRTRNGDIFAERLCQR